MEDGRSDADLIARARTGDTEAWAQLYQRHAEVARRVAIGLAGPGRADDLVADAFLGIWGSLQRGSGPTEMLRPYLVAVIRNNYADMLRDDARYLRPFHEHLDDHVEPPGDEIELRTESSVLCRAVNRLPERWRAALWYAIVEGESAAELGVRFGISANNASALTYRAREGLRQAYLAEHIATSADAECTAVRDLLPAYHRGRATAAQRVRVRRHLRACAECQRVAAGLDAIMTPRLAVLLFPGIAGLGWRRVRSVVAAGLVAAAAGAAVFLVSGGDGPAEPPSAHATVGPVPSTKASPRSPVPVPRRMAARPLERPGPVPPAVPSRSPSASPLPVPPVPGPPVPVPPVPVPPRPAPLPPASIASPPVVLTSPAPAAPVVTVDLPVIHRESPGTYRVTLSTGSTAGTTTFALHLDNATGIRAAPSDPHTSLRCDATVGGTATCTVTGPLDPISPVEFLVELSADWAGGSVTVSGDPEAGSLGNTQDLPDPVPLDI